MKAKVEVFLKPGVLDVQGKAIEGALHGLGFGGVAHVRVGKTIAFDLPDGDKAAAEVQVKSMCDRLLANAVIESYRVIIESSRDSSPDGLARRLCCDTVSAAG